MDHTPLVSIIVPVWNRAHLIARAVSCLQAQTYRNIEIIVVDDCSKDDIEGAVAAIGDPRVRLIRRQKNGGAAAARNTGVAAARGDLIAFHDSDDICLHDKIARQVDHLASLPPDHIGTAGMVVFYSGGGEANYAGMRCFARPGPHEAPLSGDLSERALRGNCINLPTLLVKKAPLVACGLFDERLRNNEDWDLSIRLSRQGKLGFIAEPLYLVEIHQAVSSDNGHISHSVRYSAQSFLRVSGKLRRQGLTAGLAPHYTAAGRYLILLGHPRLARRFFAAALQLTPRAPRLWAHYLLSHVPALHRRLQQRLWY